MTWQSRDLLSSARREWAWIAGGLALGALALAALVLGTGLARPGPGEGTPAQPLVTLVVVPSATPTRATTPTPIPGPTSSPPPTIDPEAAIDFSIGDLVEVFGTGGDGLRLRTAPSLDGAILVLGVESEVFEVVGGPEYADGYVWVRLVNPFDSAKNGWAVSSYLRPLGGQ